MKAKTKNKKKESDKIHITARVDRAGVINCEQIAAEKEWSFNQVINKTLKTIKAIDL